MPIYVILCPECGSVSKTLVLPGCRMPDEWVCGACGGTRAHPHPQIAPQPHPWEAPHASGCLCCAAPAQKNDIACVAVDASTRNVGQSDV